MNKISESEKRRLLYQCRRGMLELDVILIPYFEQNQHEMTAAEGQQLARFLNEADPDLYTWLMGYGTPKDAAFVECVSKIRAFNRSVND